MLSLGDIHQVAIAGAGVMGQGIATVFAAAGYRVNLYDPAERQLQLARNSHQEHARRRQNKGAWQPAQAEAFLTRMHYSTRLEDAVGELVLEAAPEQLVLKHQLLQRWEELLPEAIFLTNTSSLAVTQVAACLKRPERCAGLHFFNPAPVMSLVEVVAAAQTDTGLIPLLVELCMALGKQPVLVQDSPGFIVNRIARHYYLEALRIAEEMGADITTIDALMESMGFKMGPFKLMDLIGIDTNHSVTQRMFEAFFYHPRFRPSVMQQQQVDARRLGQKTAQGFYTYPKTNK